MRKRGQVSGKYARALLQDPGGRRDPESESLLGTSEGEEAYLLADGRVLVIDRTSLLNYAVDREGNPRLVTSRKGGQIEAGVLYPSKQAMRDILQRIQDEAATQPAARHILEGMSPAGPDFVREVPALIDPLAERLRIPRENLDGTLESIKTVQEGIRKRGYQRSIRPDIFVPLVAYVGEVIRKRVQGKWHLRLDTDTNTYEPYIEDREGRLYNPWMELFKELIHYGHPRDLVDTVEYGILLYPDDPRQDPPFKSVPVGFSNQAEG